MEKLIKQSPSIESISMPKRQAGVVLVMSLVMLTVLTLIGVSSMSTASLEMKVAANMQQRNPGF